MKRFMYLLFFVLLTGMTYAQQDRKCLAAWYLMKRL